MQRYPPGKKPLHSITDAGGVLGSKKSETRLTGETPGHCKRFRVGLHHISLNQV